MVALLLLSALLPRRRPAGLLSSPSSSSVLALLLLLAVSSSSAATPHLRSSSPSSETSAAAAPLGVPGMRGLDAGQDMQQQQCFKSLDWTSENGEILVNGQPFHLKGTSWFGFETVNEFPHGLWASTADDIFSFLRNNSFNALRLPVSAKLALDPNKQINANVMDVAFRNMTAMQLMGAIIDKAAEYDIVVMLDMHRLNEDFIPELWYDADYTVDNLLTAWDNLLTGLAGKWNLFALDLKNEPHGMATWGEGNPLTDWNTAAELISQHIYSKHALFKGLVFVEGVQMPFLKNRNITRVQKWWGGDLEGVWDNPIDLGSVDLNKRIVYSPHVYGPDVFLQDFFQVKDFPDNLPAIWEDQWAFVEGQTDRAVVIGEWGGHYDTPRDTIWQDALAAYLVNECLEDTFYWCLNPNSGDTGGLLADDFKTPVTAKLELLARVQPSPSFLSTSSGQGICYTPGQYANPACKGGGGRKRKEQLVRRKAKQEEDKKKSKGQKKLRKAPAAAAAPAHN